MLAHSAAKITSGSTLSWRSAFMALGPALKMSALMPGGSEALPVFKVLYRNSNRIQEFGGRESETPHALSASASVNEPTAALLYDAIAAKDADHTAKYFHTVWDDFHTTRPSARWRNLSSLARVTASEFGSPAAGQAEARELLGVSSRTPRIEGQSLAQRLI